VRVDDGNIEDVFRREMSPFPLENVGGNEDPHVRISGVFVVTLRESFLHVNE
jgi:hypothetical protein